MRNFYRGANSPIFQSLKEIKIKEGTDEAKAIIEAAMQAIEVEGELRKKLQTQLPIRRAEPRLPFPPPPHLLPYHMRPPGSISPYDPHPDAIRARGWVPLTGPMGSGPGWYSPGQNVPIGGTVIYPHDAINVPIGSLQFADPNNSFSRGIRLGPPGLFKS